jgi:uncharacterized protein YaiE (UPF0345 family)
MRRIILAAAAAAAVAAGVVAAAAPAGASTAPAHKVVAITFSPGHTDTTSASGSATVNTPNGPQWATDQLGETFTVAPVSGLADGANYSVNISVVGSFKGFADPRMASEGSSDPGGPLNSHGLMLGHIQYDVSSPTAPRPTAVPRVEAPDSHLSTVLDQLFGGSEQIVGGGHYKFGYYLIDGAPYTQVG